MSLGKFIDRAICRNIHPCSSDFLQKVFDKHTQLLESRYNRDQETRSSHFRNFRLAWRVQRELLFGNETRQGWLHSIPNIHFLISHRAMSIRIKVGLLSSPSSWHTLAIKRRLLEQQYSTLSARGITPRRLGSWRSRFDRSVWINWFHFGKEGRWRLLSGHIFVQLGSYFGRSNSTGFLNLFSNNKGYKLKCP